MRRVASTPSISGIVTSMRTTSGWSSSARRTASSPSRGLADDVEALLGHRAAEAFAQHPVVVGQHQPDRPSGRLVRDQSRGALPLSGSSQTRTAVPATGVRVEVEAWRRCSRPARACRGCRRSRAGRPRPSGKPTPSSTTSSRRRNAVAPPRDRELGRPRVALDVGDRLLGDAPHLPLLEDRESSRLLRCEGSTRRPLRSDTRSRNCSSVGGHVLHLGDVGAQVVERVADLADHAADVVAEVVEGLSHVARPCLRPARCGRARTRGRRATGRCGRAGRGRCGCAPRRRRRCAAGRTSGRCRWPGPPARRSRFSSSTSRAVKCVVVGARPTMRPISEPRAGSTA